MARDIFCGLACRRTGCAVWAFSGDWYFLIQTVPKTPAHAPVSPIYGGYADKYKKVSGVWKI